MATFQERINQFRQGLDTQQNHFNDAMGMASDYGRQVLEDKLGQHYENIEKIGGTVMSAGLALGSAKNTFKSVAAKYRAMKSGKPQAKAPKEQEPIQMSEIGEFEPAEREAEREAPLPQVAEQQASKDPLEEVKNVVEERGARGAEQLNPGEGYRIDYASLDDPAPATTSIKGKGPADVEEALAERQKIQDDLDRQEQEEEEAQPSIGQVQQQLRPTAEDISGEMVRNPRATTVKVYGGRGGAKGGGLGPNYGDNYRLNEQGALIDADKAGPAQKVDFSKPSAGVGSGASEATQATVVKISDEADMRNFSAPGAGDNIARIFQEDANIRSSEATGSFETPTYIKPTPPPTVSETLPSVSKLKEVGGTGITRTTQETTGLRTGGVQIVGSDTSQRLGQFAPTETKPNVGSGTVAKAPPTGTGTAEQMSAKTSQLASQVEQRAGEGLAAGKSLLSGIAEGGATVAAQALGGSKNIAEKDVGAVAGGGIATKQIASAGKKVAQKAGLVGEDVPSAVSEPTTQLGQIADKAGQGIIDATGALKQGASNMVRSGLGALGVEEGSIDSIMAVGGVAAEAVPVIGDLVGAGMLIYGLVKDFQHAKSYTPQLSAPQLETTEQAGGIDTQALGGSKNTGGGIV